jgi:hypothetical protein
VLNDVKKIKVKNCTEKPGMKGCRRPDPTRGCSVTMMTMTMMKKKKKNEKKTDLHMQLVTELQSLFS